MYTTSKNGIVKITDFLVERVVTRFCSTLISVNQQAHDFWVTQGVPDEKIQVIPVPVNTRLFAPSEDLRTKMRCIFQINPRSLVFAYIGRLSSEKISCSLLEAFHLANVDSKLLIVGDGPLMSALRSYVRSKNIEEKVIFTGFRNDVSHIINAVDVLVLPSFVEGTSTVILEAFSNGKAVVASDIPANREIIMNEKDGILFDPNNVKQLKDIIIRLSEDPILRKRLATNGRKKASNYDVEKVLKEILDAYRRILSARQLLVI
jgi:glycosyltransferase involved in cell wall biosynthesis